MRLPASWTDLERGARSAASHDAPRPGSPTGDALARLQHPVASAKVAGLRYVTDARTSGIRRLGPPKRFRYVGPDRRPVGASDLQRIRALAIPPAWTDVWICPTAISRPQVATAAAANSTGTTGAGARSATT